MIFPCELLILRNWRFSKILKDHRRYPRHVPHLCIVVEIVGDIFGHGGQLLRQTGGIIDVAWICSDIIRGYGRAAKIFVQVTFLSIHPARCAYRVSGCPKIREVIRTSAMVVQEPGRCANKCDRCCKIPRTARQVRRLRAFPGRGMNSPQQPRLRRLHAPLLHACRRGGLGEFDWWIGSGMTL